MGRSDIAASRAGIGIPPRTGSRTPVHKNPPPITSRKTVATTAPIGLCQVGDMGLDGIPVDGR